MRRCFAQQLMLAASVLTLFVLSGCAGGGAAKSAATDSYREPIEQSARAGRIAYDRGEFDIAIARYRRTLEAAHIRDDLQGIVLARQNLAVCETRRGRYDDALDHLRHAQRESRDRDVEPSAELLLLESQCLYRLTRLGDAQQALQTLLSTSQPAPALRAAALILQAHIMLDRGDIESARQNEQEIQRLQGGAANPAQMELQGRLAMTEQRWPQAIETFDAAAQAYRQREQYMAMAQSLARAGEAAHASQQKQRAATYLLRAGRTAALLQRPDRAEPWLEQSLQLVDQTNRPHFTAELRKLLNQLRQVSQTPSPPKPTPPNPAANPAAAP